MSPRPSVSEATATLTDKVYALSRPSSSGVEIPSSLKVGLSSWIT